MGKKNIPSLYDHNKVITDEEIDEESLDLGTEPDDVEQEEEDKPYVDYYQPDPNNVIPSQETLEEIKEKLQEDILGQKEEIKKELQEDTQEQKEDELDRMLDEAFEQAGKITKEAKNKPTAEPVEITNDRKLDGGYVMSKMENGRRKVKFEGMDATKGITIKKLEEFDTKAFEAAITKEIGTGKSSLTGTLEVHIPRKEIEEAIIKMIDIAVEQAAKVGIEIGEYAEKFIESIQGLSVIRLADDMGKQTIQNFVIQIADTLMDSGMSKEEAENKAIEIGSSYIGKDILKLKASAASMPAEVLTLVVDKACIPDEEDAALSIITKGWINEVRSFTTDSQHVRIAIATDKLFGLAQSSFTAEELDDKKTKRDSVTFKPINNILHEVVYIIVKSE